MASTYLSWTPSGAGSTTKWTTSFWVKRGNLGGTQELVANWGSGSDNTTVRFLSGNTLEIVDYQSNSVVMKRVTNRLFRDTSAWYHIVVNIDTTQSTADDRTKLYINGVQETSFSTTTNYSLSGTQKWNTTYVHNVGQSGGSAGYFDGSISHLHMIDGTAYEPTAFGEFDANGVWKIKTSPSVTYGTNGFWILKDGNSVTDQSGNGNNFTVSGGTLTNTEDNPSNVFATLNPLVPSANLTFSKGNLQLDTSGSDPTGGGLGTLGVSQGKWYWEVKFTSNAANHTHGVISELTNPYQTALQNKTGVTYFLNDDGGEIVVDGTATTNDYGTLTTGDILGVALNADDGQISFYKNGTALVTGYTISTTRGTLFPFIKMGLSTTAEVNFGNGYFGTTAVASAGTNASGIGIFEYDVPSGYTALSTKGLNL